MSLQLQRWHGDAPPASEENGWNDARHELVHELTIPDLTFWGCGC